VKRNAPNADIESGTVSGRRSVFRIRRGIVSGSDAEDGFRETEEDEEPEDVRRGGDEDGR